MTAVDTNVETVAVRDELAKFFALADLLGGELEMFSPCIDAEWHALISDPVAYEKFCKDAGTSVWGHKAASGVSVIEWVPEYHDRWGDLPRLWFADATGRVDEGKYQEYFASKVVEASWDCTPYPKADAPAAARMKAGNALEA